VSEELKAKVRAMACAGHSKTMTYELLGLTRYAFDKLVAQMPDVQFPGSNQSLGYKASVTRKRGVYTERMRRASYLAGLAHRAKARRTVRGVTGTVEELVEHFRCEVSAPQVNRRVRQGMSLEEALFKPRITRNNLGRLLGAHHDNRQNLISSNRNRGET